MQEQVAMASMKRTIACSLPAHWQIAVLDTQTGKKLLLPDHQRR